MTRPPINTNMYKHLTNIEEINIELNRLSREVEAQIHGMEPEKAYLLLRIYEFKISSLAERHAEILGIDFPWEEIVSERGGMALVQGKLL